MDPIFNFGLHFAAGELNNDFVLGKASKPACQKRAENSIFMPAFIIYSWVQELFSFWGNKGCWMLMLTNQKSLNLISKGGLLKTTKSCCFKDPFLKRVSAD